MRQFTSYLYEYDQGRRIRNVGFVRVQPGEDTCIVHIHGKGLRMQGEKNLNIYLFYEEDGTCIGIWQGAVENVNPAINYRLTYTPQDDGMDLHYQQICGIILKSNRGQTYSAVWDDHMAEVEAMKLWVREKAEPVPEEKPVLPDEIGASSSEREDQAPMFEYPRPERSDLPDEELEEAGLAVAVESQEEVVAKEVPKSVESRNETTAEETAPQEPAPGGLQQNEEAPSEVQAESEESEIQQSADDFSCRCKKIQRNDLVKLPRCEWRLANNSFLLHGYYNYKHLMLIREESRCLLGVPGIYHPREARAAATFGFVEFIPMAKLDESWEEEPNENERFGYWCRQVREPVSR